MISRRWTVEAAQKDSLIDIEKKISDKSSQQYQRPKVTEACTRRLSVRVARQRDERYRESEHVNEY